MRGFTYDVTTGEITGTLVVAREFTFLAQAEGDIAVIEYDDLKPDLYRVDISVTPHVVVLK